MYKRDGVFEKSTVCVKVGGNFRKMESMCKDVT
jgi:hypothetical protein